MLIRLESCDEAQMTKAERRLLRLRNARNSSTYAELRTVLLSEGFRLESGRGSHRVFVHSRWDQIHITLAERRGTLFPAYVVDTIAAIDAARALNRAEGVGDEIS